MNLSDTERNTLTERTARLEARTGVQIVAAVVGKCDAYPEIPWKAFALCSGLAFLATMLWHPDAVLGGLTFLGTGAAAALASIFLPAFARLFIDAARREAETRQYAASFFLAHDLSRTQGRNGILILVGVFERTVVILPDSGIRDRIAETELQEVIARMTPLLAAGRIAPALRDGLDALEALLAARGFSGGAGADEIAQEVFEEKGA
ncbi:MAG: TPM domain-containing protein [Rhodocyclales bacterium]|nr:TPM domain-containing protein [Rhodocyclales bacterium]